MRWPQVMIADFCKTGSGGTPNRGNQGDYFDGNIPWIKSGELRDQPLFSTEERITEKALKESSAKLVPPGAVLIAMYGATVGRTALLEIEAATNQAICFVVPDHRIALDRYVWYGLRASYNDLLAKRVGGAQPNISQQIVRATKLLLPPMSEQAHIVEILDEADRLRRLRREADAKAARILPALFLKMFGDPATNPMGWNTGTLGSFGAKVRYGLGQPPKESSTGLPLIRATNVNAGRITKRNMLFVDALAVPKTRNAFLDSEEVIVVRSGAYTGDVAQVTEEWKGAVIGYDLVITPPTGWTGEFVEQYLLTSFVQKGYFISQRTRAGQPHLNSSQLEATPMFSPHPITQSIFADKVRSIRKLCSKCDETSERLGELFSNLLERTFSGQLTAKWREAHIKKLLAEMEQQARLLNLPLPKELELTP